MSEKTMTLFCIPFLMAVTVVVIFIGILAPRQPAVLLLEYFGAFLLLILKYASAKNNRGDFEAIPSNC